MESGANSTGPCVSVSPSCVSFSRYRRVPALCDTARDERNISSNPLSRMRLYSEAIPAWFQSLPTIGARCPITSLFVIVPSTSDTTIFERQLHKYRCALTVCFPQSDDENENATTFFPKRRRDPSASRSAGRSVNRFFMRRARFGRRLATASAPRLGPVSVTKRLSASRRATAISPDSPAADKKSPQLWDRARRFCSSSAPRASKDTPRSRSSKPPSLALPLGATSASRRRSVLPSSISRGGLSAASESHPKTRSAKASGPGRFGPG
mmetsp:Transcript_4111/g.17445  ORF Transcript_4111/g.17445 Transcript_4111/m.17445 type:complete len:267 (+) Transcript_4111:564-1364(+)